MTPETPNRQTVRLRNYYPRTIVVDADGGEVEIPIRVRRFTPDQLVEFQVGWSFCQNPPSERAIYRKPDEMEFRSGTTMYVIPPAEIRRRRLVEMTEAERVAFEAADRADAEHVRVFCSEQVSTHVTVDPTVKLVVEDDQGDPRTVKTGADLVAVFGGNLETLMEFTAAIWFENTLSPAKKKALRARSASTTSSAPSSPDPTGTAPAETAAPVEPTGSASPADASVPPAQTPSSVTV